LRTLRNVIVRALPIVGMFIVIGAALLIPDSSLPTRVVLVVVGLLVVEASVWKLADPLLPSERQYHALRQEGDRFIRLIRELNRAALVAAPGAAAPSPEMQAVKGRMLESVDRMMEVAGKTEDEVGTTVRADAVNAS
jgi:hypothetical protein